MHESIGHQAVRQIFVQIGAGKAVGLQKGAQQVGASEHHEEARRGKVVFIEANARIIEVEEPA